MNAFEVFAYWNGRDIYNALNYVASIMGGGDYLGLMKAMALVGLLGAVTYAFLSQRSQAIGTYFFGFVFVYMAIFVPKTTMIVNDVRAARTYTVSNVPLGLAASYAAVSRIGHFLTTQYEANFTSIDDERYSKTGMVFAARVLETMAAQGFPDPALKGDVIAFYKDCIVPELVENGALAKTLKNSKDLAADLQSIVNPGRGTVLNAVTYQGSSSMSCADVISSINTYLTTSNVAQQGMAKIGQVVRADEGATTTAILATAAEGDVNSMLSNMMAISQTAQEALAQSMWINGLHDADLALRNGYGNSQATSYTVAVTEQSNRQSAYAGKMWAEKALPLIRNTAEFVLVSAFPLIFIILLVAGENALRVLKLYLTVLTSLALWAPFTAILNSLVISNGKQAIQAMKATGGGITLENINGLIDLALQQQSLAGQLFLAVPMVAYALVSAGAQAATSAVGSLTASAANVAGQVGGQIAQGNLSTGQVGWSNVNAMNTTMGQSNTAMSMRSGFVQQETGAGMMVIGGGAPGGGTFNGRTSQLGSYSASLETAVEAGFRKQVDGSMSASQSAISSALQSIRDVQASGFRSENATKAEKAFSSALATTNASERSRLAAEGAAYAAAASTEAATSKASNKSLQVQGGGSLNIGLPGVSLNAGASASTNDSNTQSSGATNRNLGQSTNSYTNQVGTRSGTSDESRLSSSSANSISSGDFAQSQLEKAQQFGLQGQAQAQKAEQASEQLSAARSDRGGIKTDLSNQVVGMLGGAAAAERLYAQDQNAFGAAVTRAAESIIAGQDLGPGRSQQLSGASGNAAVSSSSVDVAQSAVMSKVGGQLTGMPAVANANPAELKNNTAAAASSGSKQSEPMPNSSGHRNGGWEMGMSPLSSRTGSNPYSSASSGPQRSPSPAAPAMPPSVSRANGVGQVSAGQLQRSAANEAKRAATDVGNAQSETMRQVGNISQESANRNKQ
jgi:conjugal transfer mating pair stabilization protein TraG